MSTAGTIVFAICAAVALAGALATVTVRSPLRAALGLLTTIVAFAGLFLTLHAHLLAVVQLIVYAGAVVVLFVFVIMLIGPATAPEGKPRGTWERAVAAGLMAVVTAALAAGLLGYAPEYAAIQSCPPGAGAECGQFGGVNAFSIHLFRKGLVPFELVSVLLTVAVVGAIMVARRVSQGRRQQVEAGAEAAASSGD